MKAACPTVIFYICGSTRVLMAYCQLNKWEVILFKFVMTCCGMMYFYIGYEFMTGKYKFSKGALLEMEIQAKDLLYLYLFAVMEMFF